MFDRIAPRYDLLNRVMSARVDQLWRRRLLSDLAPKDGERLLDLCAGTMDVAAMARRRVPGLAIVGADFSFQMLSRGVEKTGLPASQADAMVDALQARPLRPLHGHLRHPERRLTGRARSSRSRGC